VLSNSYMNELAREAATLGVYKALLKVRCSPSILLAAIHEALEGKAADEDASVLLAAPAQSPPPQSPARMAQPASQAPAPAPAPQAAQLTTAEFQARARRSFLRDAPTTCIALRTLFQAFVSAPNETERDLRLQALCRKVHFIAATAGLAECHRLAQMASVFEALLFELVNRPVSISPSVLRTIASTVDFLTLLFDCACDADLDAPLSAQGLVVEDDSLTNQLVVAALLCAHLQARSTEDPLEGLQWLKETHFDFVVLDIQMPGMDGFEFCRRLRLLPGHQKTPVIYVTSYGDFENRAKSVLTGGGDLIAKPVFPLELAVKAVAHLLKNQMAPA
jgi:CheY-like chemotaxis protein